MANQTMKVVLNGKNERRWQCKSLIALVLLVSCVLVAFHSEMEHYLQNSMMMLRKHNQALVFGGLLIGLVASISHGDASRHHRGRSKPTPHTVDKKRTSLEFLKGAPNNLRQTSGIDRLHQMGIGTFKPHPKLLGSYRLLDRKIQQIALSKEATFVRHQKLMVLAFERVSFRERAVFVKYYVERKSLTNIAWEEHISTKDVEIALRSVLSMMGDVAKEIGLASTAQLGGAREIPRTLVEILNTPLSSTDMPASLREKTIEALDRSQVISIKNRKGTADFLDFLFDRSSLQQMRVFEMVYLNNQPIEEVAEGIDTSISKATDILRQLERSLTSTRLIWPTTTSK